MFVELQVAPEVVKTDAGSATIWKARPGLVFTRVEGRMVMAHAQAIMSVVDAEMRALPGKVKVFHDFTAIESYEIVVQARMSAWSVTAMRFIERIVIGVSSPWWRWRCARPIWLPAGASSSCRPESNWPPLRAPSGYGALPSPSRPRFYCIGTRALTSLASSTRS